MGRQKLRQDRRDLKSSVAKFHRLDASEKQHLAEIAEDPVRQYCAAVCPIKKVRTTLLRSHDHIHPMAASVLTLDSEPEVLIELLKKEVSGKMERKLYPNIAKVVIADIKQIINRRNAVEVTGLLRAIDELNGDFRYLRKTKQR